MARRLVETGVPFVEVDLGGWDTHRNNFTSLETKLPEMDQAMAALVADLSDRGMLDNVAFFGWVNSEEHHESMALRAGTTGHAVGALWLAVPHSSGASRWGVPVRMALKWRQPPIRQKI